VCVCVCVRVCVVVPEENAKRCNRHQIYSDIPAYLRYPVHLNIPRAEEIGLIISTTAKLQTMASFMAFT